jgi:hypothetical protein
MYCTCLSYRTYKKLYEQFRNAEGLCKFIVLLALYIFVGGGHIVFLPVYKIFLSVYNFYYTSFYCKPYSDGTGVHNVHS